MQSDAETVEDYIDSLPAGRREAIGAVREAILLAMPEGYDEVMRWGMITYEVPLDVEPERTTGNRSCTPPSPRRRITWRSI